MLECEVTTASRKATGSGDTVARLEGGIGLTLRRANQVIETCGELWPKSRDADWPAEVERPKRKRQKRGVVDASPE